MKFQTFKSEELAAINTPKADYQKESSIGEESHLDMLKKMEPEENENKENPIWKGLDKFKNLND